MFDEHGKLHRLAYGIPAYTFDSNASHFLDYSVMKKSEIDALFITLLIVIVLTVVFLFAPRPISDIVVIGALAFAGYQFNRAFEIDERIRKRKAKWKHKDY